MAPVPSITPVQPSWWTGSEHTHGNPTVLTFWQSLIQRWATLPESQALRCWPYLKSFIRVRLANLMPVPPISIVAMVIAFTCKRERISSWFLLFRSSFLYVSSAAIVSSFLINFCTNFCGANSPVWLGVVPSRERFVAFWHAQFSGSCCNSGCNLLHFLLPKGCWTNLRDASRAGCLNKLPDAATLPSCFSTWGWSSVSASFRSGDKRSAPERWHSTAYSTSKARNIVLLVLEIAPITSSQKPEEWLQLSSSQNFIFMQTFIGYCYPLTSSYKLTKACWCWFSGFFPRSSRFIWPCDHLINAFRVVAWTSVMSFDQKTDAVILGSIGKRVLKRICGSSTKMVISVSRGMVVSSSERLASVHKLDNASLLRIQLFIRANWDGQVMLEQDFGIRALFSNLISC